MYRLPEKTQAVAAMRQQAERIFINLLLPEGMRNSAAGGF